MTADEAKPAGLHAATPPASPGTPAPAPDRAWHAPRRLGAGLGSGSSTGLKDGSSTGLSAGLILLLAIGLLPALAGTAWYLYHMRELALRDAFEQADLIATSTAERLQWQLQDAQAMMSALADRPRVRALDARLCDPIFQEARSVSPSYRALALRRLDGSSVCSELANPPPSQPVAAAAWFRTAVAQEGFHASDAHAGTVNQPWAARLTYPVRDDRGERAGLLIAPLDLKQLQLRLFAQLPSTATVVVVDGSYRVLVGSQRQDERVGKRAAESVVRVLDEMRAQRALDEMRLERTGLPPGAPMSRQFAEVGIGGARNLFVVRNVALTDWFVVTALPEAQTLAAYHASRTRSLAAIALILLLAGLAAWRVSRAILVPIRALAGAARNLAAGHVSAPAPETGPREIREVAREFNRMVRATDESRASLQASENRYRALILNLPVGVLSCTAEGQVELFNDRACALLGLSPAQLEACDAHHMPWRLLDDQGCPLKPGADPASRVLNSRSTLAPEILGVSAGGADSAAHTWIMATGYPQFDGQGQLLRAIVVFVDVTTQRLAEQLRVDKEAAEAASRAKSVFLSRVSHELRTPLNAINGFSELLLGDDRLDEGARGKLRHVLNAGRHLLSLIEQLMDLSRLESGLVLPLMQPIALWPLLEECVALFVPLAQARRVTVELRRTGPTAEAGPWVQGDETWLRQVLMNLLSNALKYNHEGGQVTLELRASADAAAGAPALRLDVVDTGPGLSAVQQAGLFQPFNRLGAENTDIEGHGLGLLISRQLAQSMGGDITVVSAPGQGACFSLHLLRSALEEPDANTSERPAA